MNYKKTILLTGAGFTKNFGGFLGREMWAKIFNHPDLKRSPKIKEKLRLNFNFEEIYAQVLLDSCDSDKNLLQEIILSAYKDMDEMLRSYNYNQTDIHQVNLHGIAEFLRLFCGSNPSNEVGLHFTLNQDLFLERRFGRRALGLGGLPYQSYREEIASNKLNAEFRVDLPTEDFIENYKKTSLNRDGDLFYVKLHGSSGWYSVNGSNQMVMGNNKLVQIMKEPLLKWYFDVFDQALKRTDLKLFVCGYSFRDDHVNKTILAAIREYGLRLYVISPMDPEDFKNMLIGKPKESSQLWQVNQEGLDIWNAISGYFPYSLKEIFPSDQSVTDKRIDLFNAINSV